MITPGMLVPKLSSREKYGMGYVDVTRFKLGGSQLNLNLRQW